MTRPTPPDHLGWDLVRAARRWEAEFTEAMVTAGHPWFAEARGRFLQHIGPSGVLQSVLAKRTGMTKQAVQQHLDRLEGDGIIRRVPDEVDQRKMRVVLGEAGLAAMRDADRIKQDIERRVAADIGAAKLSDLKILLKLYIERE